MKHTVLIGVSSGIAAYKVLNLISSLKKDGCDVFVTMTRSAIHMVKTSDLEKASGNKVAVELFEKDFNYKNILSTRKVEHIDLADKADVMVIVPATANVIAKIANGLADDFLTTTALAVTAPVIICPSMNPNMWNNPITKQNINKLKSLGFHIIDPTNGMLACGYEGPGRLENPEVIKTEILKQLNRTKSLAGKKIIVTAGGTTEKIDDVRTITNRSSGKMGIAIAEELYLRGADVLLLRATNSILPRYLIRQETFETAENLFNLLKEDIKKADYIFHVAAVADFKVISQKGKIKSDKPATIELTPQIKILDQLKKLNPKIKLIAFKAESGLSEKDLTKLALKRLKESKADAIVVNDIGKTDRGFESDNNEVIIVTRKEYKKIPLAPKAEIARKILDFWFRG